VFHPALAAKFSEDRIAVGLGVPIYRGDIFINQIRLMSNPYDYILNSRPYDWIPKLYEVDGFGYGVGVNLGVQFHPSDKLSLGASYTSSASLTLDGESSERVFLPFNQGIINLYNDPQANPEQIEIKDTYSGNEFTVESTFEVEWTLPSEFGFGIGYQAGDNLLLAADLTYTMWSEFEDMEIKIGDRIIGRSVYATWRTLLSDLVIPLEWDDNLRLSFGAEGVLNERWVLRGGYMFDDSPIPDETFSQLFMDTGTKHHLSAGAKFFLNETISFEGAVQAVLFSERTVEEAVDFNNDGLFDNMPGTYQNLTFSSTWAFNYRF
jgi:long-chain fatty acid transport protein